MEILLEWVIDWYLYRESYIMINKRLLIEILDSVFEGVLEGDHDIILDWDLRVVNLVLGRVIEWVLIIVLIIVLDIYIDKTMARANCQRLFLCALKRTR